MTVASPTNVVSYTGNGVTTVFDYAFLILEGTAQVTLTEIATGIEGDPIDAADYNITGEDNENGGTIEYPLVGDPLAATHKINIKRVVDIEQVLALNNQSAFFPELLEGQLDRIVMMIGQQQEQIDRAILVGTGAISTPQEFIDALLDAASSAEAAAATATAAAGAAATSETNAENAADAAAAAVTAQLAGYVADGEAAKDAAEAAQAAAEAAAASLDPEAFEAADARILVSTKLFLHGRLGGL
jgi:hypothetical protein